METRSIAIACQGGGIHGAFTCGVLDAILEAKDAESRGQARPDAQRCFELSGLSGTSAGALNAFMVWYGLTLRAGEADRFAVARQSVNQLWDTFKVQRRGEWAMNWFGQQSFRAESLGVSAHPTHPPLFYDWLVSSLRQWSRVETSVAPHADFGEVRPEFYDFASLLRTCAPEFPTIEARLPEIARARQSPRLLVGAIEILSGVFETFDSFDREERPDARRTISYEAVEASGTLPEIRRSQAIPGLKNEDGLDARYWDGLFSQNPPVIEFLSRAERPEEKPDEIWVIQINPQKREREPISYGDITDRRNELSGNLSLYQELRHIQWVNGWARQMHGWVGALSAAVPAGQPPAAELARLQGFCHSIKEVDVYMLTMATEMSDVLDLASKFDRDPHFVQNLRDHGRARALEFLDYWTTASRADCHRIQWPRIAVPAIRDVRSGGT